MADFPPRRPRPHQVEALSKLRTSLGTGKTRPCLMLPTGAGKTFIGSWVIRGALDRGHRICFTVPALSLVDQTVEALEAEGIEHVGVIQGDHRRTDPTAPVQVASVQTLAQREFPDSTLVIVDECHREARAITRWMRERPGVRFIGLSATPGRAGMDVEYDDLVVGATTKELIEQGVLSPFRVYAAAHPDLSGVKVVAGDFHEGQLAEVMSKGGMIADVVATWIAKAEGRPTLCFAVDRAHARKLEADFAAAGVAVAYVDGETPTVERAEIEERFHRGEIQVVVNIGVLTTGVDWDVRCIILARPTKSEMLFVQMIGRGLRKPEGKTDCLILDHSDTTLRLGFPDEIVFDHLPSKGKGEARRAKAEAAVPKPRECTECHTLRPSTVFACPQCGHAPIEMIQGDLVQVDRHGAAPAPKGPRRSRMPLPEQQAWYSGLLWLAAAKGRRQGWAAHAFKDRFGHWPDGLSDTRRTPSEEIRRWERRRSTAFLEQRGRTG